MSIVKIAKEAGVSVSTVSRFFNTPEGVSAAATERIQTAVLRSNYQRSERRPGPKTGARHEVRTGVIMLLVITDVAPEIWLKRPLFPDFLGCLQRAVSERQLALQIAFTGLDGEVPDIIDRKRCDGVILWGASDSPEFLPQLKKRLGNLPAVWCFRKHNDPERSFDHILYDNAVIGTLAADYLFQRGHRKVAVFNSSLKHDGFLERVARFEARADELGLKFINLSAEDDFNLVAATRYLAERFLGDPHEDITGAFFCADHILFGIFIRLQSFGFRLETLDAIGVNGDSERLNYFSPRPASIDIKINEIAEMSVRNLLRRIKAEHAPYRCEIFTRPELIPGTNLANPKML